MCFRCQATRRVDALLTGADGRVPEGLAAFRDAVVAMDNPRSVLSNFGRSRASEILASIVGGDAALTHDTLDTHLGNHSIEHLRSLLVAAGALPARDEHQVRLQRFVTDFTAAITEPDDRRTLASFARWHLLPRIRRRDQPLTANVAYRARGELATAARFLAYLRARSRDLSTCRQSDLDAWFDRRPAARHSRGFLRWALTKRLLTGVQIPAHQVTQPGEFTGEDDRWSLARRMLHDDTARTDDRVAACLVLLFAQPITRITALTTEHVTSTQDGGATLRLGHTAITLPPALATLVIQLPNRRPTGAAAALTDHHWLFPGRRPNQPMHANTLAARLRALGVNPRPDRNSALLDLARQLPPTVVGKLLGVHPVTAARWTELAGGTWTRYSALSPAATAHPADRSDADDPESRS